MLCRASAVSGGRGWREPNWSEVVTRDASDDITGSAAGMDEAATAHCRMPVAEAQTLDRLRTFIRNRCTISSQATPDTCLLNGRFQVCFGRVVRHFTLQE